MTEPASFDVLGHLLQRWKTVALVGFFGLASGVAYGLFAPKWYAATLTVVPSQRSEDSASSLAAKLPIAIDTTPASVQRIQAVLTSNSVADEVIKKFALEDRYDAPAIELARKSLWSHCVSSVDRRSSVVSLSCEDKDPKVAMEMASYFGQVGNKVFGRISASSAREERKFLETQVTKARSDVETASRELKEFQEQHKIVDLPEQSRAVISAMATIKGELVSKQLELSYLSSFSSRTEASVQQLEQQIAVMNSKLSELEASQAVAVPTSPPPAKGSAAPPDGDKFFPGAMNVPELRLELERLLREQKIAETVFFLMTQRYEMAKVDEARDTSTFQILDEPTLPTYKSRPQRLKVALLSLVGSVALACALILVPAWVRARSVRS